MLEGPAIRDVLRFVGDEWGVLDLALAIRCGNLSILTISVLVMAEAWVFGALQIYLQTCRHRFNRADG